MIKPEYPIATIKTGLYTPGNELVYGDTLLEYVGLYHELPNGQKWTGAGLEDKHSKLLIELDKDITENVKIYNNIKKKYKSNYVNPIPYRPILSTSDYELGYFYRYFVQKRNNLKNIVEISSDQYSFINKRNKFGINELLWDSVYIKWYVVGELADKMNKKSILKAENKMKYISKFITNYLEFIN